MMEGDSDEPGVHSWQELLELGDGVPEAEIEARIDAQRPEDPATLIYTSGTTGPPKAVMLSHTNLVWTVEAGARVPRAPGRRPVPELSAAVPHRRADGLAARARCTSAAAAGSPSPSRSWRTTCARCGRTSSSACPGCGRRSRPPSQAAGAQNPPLKRKIAAWARGVGKRAGYAEQRGEARAAAGAAGRPAGLLQGARRSSASTAPGSAPARRRRSPSTRSSSS